MFYQTFHSLQYQIDGHNGSLHLYYTQVYSEVMQIPSWFRRMDFMPWLEYMKEQKRLHIIKDPSVSGDLNKRLQCTEEKIKAKMKNMKLKIEEGESSTTSAPKRKTEGKKKPERKKRKSIKAPSKESSPEPDADSTDPVAKSEVSPILLPKQKRGIPPLPGRVPGTSKLPPVTSAGGSDIDSEDSETDGQ